MDSAILTSEPSPHGESPTYDIHPADLVALMVEATQLRGVMLRCDAEATKAAGLPRFKVFLHGDTALLEAAADEVIDFLRDLSDFEVGQ